MKLKTKNRELKTDERGFSLVELLLAITLGSMVILAVSAIFVQSVRLERRAFFIQRIQENISFVLESMAKEIRVSTISTSNTTCPASPGDNLTIVHPVNGNIKYFLSNGEIHRQDIDNGIDTTLSSFGIVVTRLSFCVSGNSLKDHFQPRVTILLSVKNSEGYETITFDTQTTVSQRFLSD